MARAAATPDTVPIDQHAADELRFIRHAIERSAVFTAVPGWGGILMGACGMAAGATRGRAALAEAHSRRLPRHRSAGDRRHPDARVNGPFADADARRGLGRGDGGL